MRIDFRKSWLYETQVECWLRSVLLENPAIEFRVGGSAVYGVGRSPVRIGKTLHLNCLASVCILASLWKTSKLEIVQIADVH